MNDTLFSWDDEGINYDEIPEITDLSKAIKNPCAGKFKDGYTIIAEHKDYYEIITITKKKRKKTLSHNKKVRL